MKKITRNIKIKVIFILALLLNESVYSQIGINTVTPDSSSALDIVSTNKGILIPRLEGSKILSMTGMANGLLVYAISVSGTINAIGFWYFNGTSWKNIGKGNTVYEDNGTLTSDRTVALQDKNLTFSATSGRLIVDAPFETTKSLFAKSIRLHPVASTITWLTDDVVILLQNGHSGTIKLPSAIQNPNRMIAVSNKSGTKPFGFTNNSEFGIYDYEGSADIKNNTITWFLSDGISWNIISDVPNEVVTNAAFAPNLQLVSKVGQSSNFNVSQPFLTNSNYIDLQVTTTGTQFPYLVNLKSNFINGYNCNSDVVTIDQSPATVRLYASGSPIDFGSGSDTFTFSATNLNGSSQLTASILLSEIPVLEAISLQPSAAYGLRRLKSNYSGPLIRVFKSVSSVISELDISFLPNGDLDASSLMTFANGGTVAIKTWYDQSGNGNTIALLNSNFSIAPIIVNAGSLVTINSKPSANYVNYGFKSSGAFPSLTIGSCSSVIEITSVPNGINKRLLAPTILLSGATGVANYSLSATGTKYVNGISSTTIALGKATLLTNFSSISTYGGFLGNIAITGQTNAFPGKISELLLFPANLNTTDRQFLETNQKNYYGL